MPVYQSTFTLRSIVDRIDTVLGPLGDYEIILVDDGSEEATWGVIDNLARGNPRLVGIRLGRNYGQHSALVAGIREAEFPVTVTMDDDLQNPPEEIPFLVTTLLQENLDVVYGVPEHVQQPLGRRLAGRLARRAIIGGRGAESMPDVSSFRALRTRTREAFAGDLGGNVSLDALLTWGSGRFGAVRVRHEPRTSGTSNYSFGKLLRFAIDTMTGYSTLPLQVASILGLAIAALSFVVLVLVIGRPLVSGQSLPGFPFLATTIAIFSGVQLLALGVIGEYLARMHFRIMRKPTYVVAETIRSEQFES